MNTTPKLACENCTFYKRFSCTLNLVIPATGIVCKYQRKLSVETTTSVSATPTQGELFTLPAQSRHFVVCPHCRKYGVDYAPNWIEVLTTHIIQSHPSKYLSTSVHDLEVVEYACGYPLPFIRLKLTEPGKPIPTEDGSVEYLISRTPTRTIVPHFNPREVKSVRVNTPHLPSLFALELERAEEIIL